MRPAVHKRPARRAGQARRNLILPFFINHEGCPHRCIFCNQKTISGRDSEEQLSGTVIGAEIAGGLARLNRTGPVQVAFYGGSFTCLPEWRQRELLTSVQPFLEDDKIASIRISTRPDGINPAGLALLREYGVKTVELGIQSLSDSALALAGRGHTAARSVEALQMLKESGFETGAQLLPGLPGEGFGTICRKARELALLKPDFIRIYPLLVLNGSVLARRYRAGEYRPMSLARAVSVCGRLKNIFNQHGIPVIRMGLPASPGLEREVIAGPYHPAFGEMVLRRNLYLLALKKLHKTRDIPRRILTMAAPDESVFRGPGNINLRRLNNRGMLKGVELIFSQEQPRGTVRVDW